MLIPGSSFDNFFGLGQNDIRCGPVHRDLVVIVVERGTAEGGAEAFGFVPIAEEFVVQSINLL